MNHILHDCPPAEANERYFRDRHLVQVFNDHLEALGIFDRHSNLVACNPAALSLSRAILGVAPTPGTNLLAHIPPERRRHVEAVIEKVLEGSLQEYEVHIPPPIDKWVRLGYYPAYDTDGSIYGFYVHAHDITQQHKTQQELQLHTTLFQNISDAVIATDLQFRITSFNGAAERIYALEADKVLGLPIAEVISYEYPCSSGVEAMEQLHQKGEWKGEVVYTRPNRQKVYLMSTVTYVRNSGGEKIGAIAVNKDITELVKAREEVSRSQAYTAMVLENMGDAFMLMDKAHRIVLFNERATYEMNHIVGATVQAGACLLDLLPAERRPAVRAHLAKVAKGRKIEYEVAYPGGKWLWVSFIPVKGPRGVPYTICIIRDISTRKEKDRRLLDEKLRHQHELAKAALYAQEKERNDIGSELHDNVNQILTAVKLQLGICLQQEGESPWLLQAQRHVQTVIDEIRQLSRRLVTPRFGEDGLAQKIETLLESYRNGLVITSDYSSFSDEAMDASTRLTLFRVVQEALNNIVRHAQAHQVWVQLLSRPHSVVLVITDDGCGFNPTAARKGVGLTNIYNRVEAGKGSVRLKTGPGLGCRLTVSLPLDS